VYDAASMATVWPDRRTLKRFFWQSAEDYQKYLAPAPTFPNRQR
jgi:hypothetical protein